MDIQVMDIHDQRDMLEFSYTIKVFVGEY